MLCVEIFDVTRKEPTHVESLVFAHITFEKKKKLSTKSHISDLFIGCACAFEGSETDFKVSLLMRRLKNILCNPPEDQCNCF